MPALLSFLAGEAFGGIAGGGLGKPLLGGVTVFTTGAAGDLAGVGVLTFLAGATLGVGLGFAGVLVLLGGTDLV